MIRVAAITSGRRIPSSRFRIRQYVPALEKLGVALTELSPGLGAYPPKNRWVRPFWGIASICSRIPSIVRTHRYDATLFQREMLSTFCTLEPLGKRPRILDVDDAIWLNRDSGFAARLARLSDLVICGNAFLADHFRQWNRNIAVVPTAVDTDRFAPRVSGADSPSTVIGWSGGRSGFPDLELIEKALQEVLRKHPEVRFRVLADVRPALDLPASQIEFVPWSPENEVQVIQSFDIGLMPLRDTLWSRGKCAYKMLLYMSCGVPVGVSPVGMTDEVSRMATVGFAATTPDEWVEGLEGLLSDRRRAGDLGRAARRLVVDQFSIAALAPRLADELLRVSKAAPKPAELT